MGAWRRREVMRAGLAAGLSLAGCGGEDAPGPAPSAEPPCDDVVRSLLDGPMDPFIPLADWLGQGVSPERLYAAALEVGARMIPPEGDLHGVLGVGAARVLADQVLDESPLMPLFRTWYDQHLIVLLADEADGSVLPELGPLPASDPTTTLLAAWEDWDTNAADSAIVALYRNAGREGVVGPLTLYGQRNHHWLGHTAIWTGHALRTLDAFGWSCAEPVLRSLARAIAANQDKSSTTAFYANLARLDAVPAGWRAGGDDPSRVPELTAVLRDGDAETCVDAVLDALSGGLSPRTIWTALAVLAVELAVRWQHESWGVHELDALNAFRHLARLTPNPELEVLALLQAAAWRPEFQAFVAGVDPVVEETLDVLTPAEGPAPSLTAALEATGGNRVEAARTMAAYFAGGGTPEAVMESWPDVVVKHAGKDVHHLKYHAALVEEAQAALPAWRRTLLLGITMRNPAPGDPAWTRYQDAQTAIAELKG